MERNVQSTVTGALNDFNALWRNWATYGLTVGKTALVTSAKTLETTAARLDEWSTQLTAPKAPPVDGEEVVAEEEVKVEEEVVEKVEEGV
jgi:hypothetical protein